MPLPISVRPARPGDGSKIAEPTDEQKRAERERERRNDHIAAVEEQRQREMREKQAYRAFRELMT